LDVERTDEFEECWETLSKPERRQILTSIELLEEHGPKAGRPTVDSIRGSKHPT
jgi:hypothetical protein